MRPVLFHIGDLAVSSFWTMAFLGFAVALGLAWFDLRRRGHDPGLAWDMTLWAYVGGWVGARLFLIPEAWSYFVEDPIAFLLSGSGWVWYGGVVGGAVAVSLWARRQGLPLLEVGDVAAPALALGHAFGRLGCQLAGDGDYGIPTSLPWGMSYPQGVVPTLDRVHPTPIYEMVSYLVICAWLWRRWRPERPRGELLSWYLVLSGATRFLVEIVRRNPRWFFGLTTAQLFSAAWVAAGLILLLRIGALPRAARRAAPAR